MEFKNIAEYLQFTHNMTPQQIAKEIYKVEYADLVAQNILSSHEKTQESQENIEKEILFYLFEQNKKIVEQVKVENAMEVDGGVFMGENKKGIFDVEAVRDVQKRDEKTWDLSKAIKKEIEFERNGENEKIFVLHNIIKDGDSDYPYIAIKLPESYHNIPRKEFYIGKQFAEHEEDWDFNINVDRNQPIQKDILFFAQRSRRPEEVPGYSDGINLRNDSQEDTDIVRETLKQGMKPMMIDHNILLAELQKDILGEEYVNFIGYKADSDETGYGDIRLKYQKIDETFGTQFNYYDKDTKKEAPQYVMRDYGVYIDKQGTSRGYLRGYFNSVDSALGGVCSVALDWGLAYSDSDFGFRPCV